MERDFTATAPDRLWCADATYVATWAGWLYLAVVIDVFSRRVVGWAVADHLRTALDHAIVQRAPDGVIHHSDQGCQYTSIAFGERCREAGIRPSTGSAMAHSASVHRSTMNDGAQTGSESAPRP